MNRFMDFIFPRYCLLCGEKHQLIPTADLCIGCYKDITLNSSPCGLCGVPLTPTLKGLSQAGATEPVCGSCLKTPPAFDALWSPFIYTQPLEWVIQRFKFNANLMFAPLLSDLMIQQIPASLYKQQRPDAVIPMPLHDKRLKHRGFNQSLLLAKPVAEVLGVPVDSKSCQRRHNTEHQTGKNARQRQQNIKGAFQFDNKKNYQYLVIFDDVVTTGSSVSELSKTLKLSGVSRVDIWSLARAERF